MHVHTHKYICTYIFYMCYHRKMFYRNIKQIHFTNFKFININLKICYIVIPLWFFFLFPLWIFNQCLYGEIFKLTTHLAGIFLNCLVKTVIWDEILVIYCIFLKNSDLLSQAKISLNWIDSLAINNSLFIQCIINNQEHVQTSS